MLRVWTCASKEIEAIIIATDVYFARRYAEKMGYTAELVEVTQPTVFERELDSDAVG